MARYTKVFTLQNPNKALLVFGKEDENLRVIEEYFSVNLIARGMEIKINGVKKEVEQVFELLNNMKKIVDKKQKLDIFKIQSMISFIRDNGNKIPLEKKLIVPKTSNQEQYVKAIRINDIVFSIGPAGTGKTYLAIASAVNFLYSGIVNRVILVRPAIEAGEKLGFLPGTFQQKINPYLRPLYDALYDMVNIDDFNNLMEKGIVEVAPLAYMRGRTLNDAFIILDEAQNTTVEQMKMFLTRLGFNSKVVITGDITQIDLPKEKLSGLIHVQKVLKNIKGVKFVYLTDKDVVRHNLVQKIILAYSNQKK